MSNEEFIAPDANAVKFAVARLQKAVSAVEAKIATYKGYEDAAIARRDWADAAKYRDLRHGMLSASTDMMDVLIDTRRMA